MLQAITLLKTALLLLAIVAQTPNVPDSLRAQAIDVANQAITAANVALQDQPQQITMTDTQAPVTAVQEAATQPTAGATPISQARIEIISPIASKGLGRQYTAVPAPSPSNPNGDYTESSYVYLGAIVYKDDGMPDYGAILSVSATDAGQNAHIDGASTSDGSVRYYPYTYVFYTRGEHVLTFQANGMTKTVTIEVQ